MNSMSNGFLYTLGFGWAMTECCLMAVAGNYLPLFLFVLSFIVIFAVLGCLNLPDSKIEKFGAIVAAVLALSLIIFTAHTFVTGAIGLGLVKLLFAIVFCGGAIVAFTGQKSGGHAAHH